MRKTVIPLVDPEIGCREAAPDLQAGHPGRIGLQGECDQVIEQGEVLGQSPVLRFPHGCFRLGDILPLLPEVELNLHIPNGGEIFIQFLPVGFAEGTL